MRKEEFESFEHIAMKFLALLVLCICAAVHGLRAMPVRARGNVRMSEPAKEGEWVSVCVVRHA